MFLFSYTYAPIAACMHACMHTYMHTLYMGYIFTYACMYVCMHMCSYIYVYTYAYYTCTYKAKVKSLSIAVAWRSRQPSEALGCLGMSQALWASAAFPREGGLVPCRWGCSMLRVMVWAPRVPPGPHPFVDMDSSLTFASPVITRYPLM